MSRNKAPVPTVPGHWLVRSEHSGLLSVVFVEPCKFHGFPCVPHDWRSKNPGLAALRQVTVAEVQAALATMIEG